MTDQPAQAVTDPLARLSVVGALPDLDTDDQAFGLVLEALRDPDERVRASAAARLGLSGRAEAVAPLVALAEATGPDQCRSSAIYSLGQLGYAGATPALVRLTQDASPDVREEAVDALGRVGGPVAAEALLAVAAGKDPKERANAAMALPSVAGADPRVLARLEELVRDEEPLVRAAVMTGLAFAGRVSPETSPLVLTMADDPATEVRSRVTVLVQKVAPDVAEEILLRYADDPDEWVRHLADLALTTLRRSRYDVGDDSTMG
jgi:HEAT repeat protein